MNALSCFLCHLKSTMGISGRKIILLVTSFLIFFFDPGMHLRRESNPRITNPPAYGASEEASQFKAAVNWHMEVIKAVATQLQLLATTSQEEGLCFWIICLLLFLTVYVCVREAYSELLTVNSTFLWAPQPGAQTLHTSGLLTCLSALSNDPRSPWSLQELI